MNNILSSVQDFFFNRLLVGADVEEAIEDNNTAVDGHEWMHTELTPPPMSSFVDNSFAPTFIAATDVVRNFAASVDMSDHPLPPCAAQ